MGAIVLFILLCTWTLNMSGSDLSTPHSAECHHSLLQFNAENGKLWIRPLVTRQSKGQSNSCCELSGKKIPFQRFILTPCFETRTPWISLLQVRSSFVFFFFLFCYLELQRSLMWLHQYLSSPGVTPEQQSSSLLLSNCWLSTLKRQPG